VNAPAGPSLHLDDALLGRMATLGELADHLGR
jgi:hypothetical protein